MLGTIDDQDQGAGEGSGPVAPEDEPAAFDREQAPSSRGRVLLAMVALLAIYGALSLLNDPHGYLGTDTGGKVLTLQAMEDAGTHTDLDVGYWAPELDPDGDVHPYYGTGRIDDRWIQVTTVPMMLAASPLYDLGGYRLALLLPMLGGVATAAAARALASRFGAGSFQGWVAYWVVGLAGPVLIYSLDLWEHTLGLAAMAWAVIALFDARARSRMAVVGALGLAAGFLFGTGFSMRTEALLYGGTTTAAILLAMTLVDRRLVRPLVLGATTAVGLAAAVVANRALEGIAIGGALRTGRTGGNAREAGGQLATRFQEGLVTTVGLTPATDTADLVMGAVAVGLVVLLVVAARRPAGSALRERLPMLAIVAVVPFLLTVRSGLGFVPGLFIASPLAIVGLASARDRRVAPLWWAAVLSLPVVWLFQYIGGAGPQWGARYALLSSFLLTVAGVVALPQLAPLARRTVLGLAVAITLAGLSWMVVRTHDVAATGEALAARPEPVLIASGPTGFLPREFVAEAAGKRWLAPNGQAELDLAVDIVVDAGFTEFGVLEVGGIRSAQSIGDFELVGVDEVAFLPGAPLQVATYRTS